MTKVTKNKTHAAIEYEVDEELDNPRVVEFSNGTIISFDPASKDGDCSAEAKFKKKEDGSLELIDMEINKEKCMKHLRLDLTGKSECNESRHPQEVMKDLGITYIHATPQSMGDQWWFWNCENIPEKLPEYIDELIADPMECIGYGLSEEDAKKILSGKSKLKEKILKASNVYKIRWDKNNLFVHFNNGGVYHYKEVPEKVSIGMSGALSPGSFLNREIKGNYRYEKIE